MTAGIRSRRMTAALALLVTSTSTAAPPALAQAPDRSRPPAVGAPPALVLPAVERRTLQNGVPVWIVETHDVPLVQVDLVVLAGSADDPAGRYGVASMTAAMLDEGAGSRSALELADTLEFLGANLATASGFDNSAIRLNVPVARLGDALPVMADVALRPTFPAPDLERLRQERLTALLQARDSPDAIAQRAFTRFVFGATHRYGTSAVGTESSVRALTVDDLRTFHRAYYQPANAALVVTGDVRTDAVMPLLERAFGSWQNASPAPRVQIPPAPQLAKGQIYLIDKPGAAQSVIQLGWVGVPRSTPDYFTIQVLNTILGGSFSSRLNRNLREEHGYAYGAGSGFDMRLSGGAFLARASVQTDKTAEALKEFFNELRGISAAPVPAEELSRAKNFVALGFPGEFETSSDRARKLEELIIYRLPETYFERYVANVQGVTAAAVQKAAATYVQPSRFAVVIVGDRQKIEAGIRATNLGPIQLMTVDQALQ